jgi:hypothetical protein
MAVSRHAGDELGPALGMTPQYEEGRLHAPLAECVENGGRRVGLGPSSKVSATARSPSRRRVIGVPKIGLFL